MPFPPPYQMHHELGAGHWVAAAVLFVLFVAIVVAIVVAVVHFVRQPVSSRASARSELNQSPTPEDVLKMRLATGEISEDEFKSRLSALTGT